MTAKSTHDLVTRTANQLELNGPQTSALAEALRGVTRANEQLVAKSVQVAAAASTVVTLVNGNRAVNELGELQSDGRELDRLCAVRQERVTALVLVLVACGVESPGSLADALLFEAS